MATQPVAASEKLRVGQKVIARSARWTPDGWEPVEEIATVVNPCVPAGADYAGDVELSIEGFISHVFMSPASVEAADATGPMSERERALRDVVIMADHLRNLAEGDTSREGWGQRRMATRIITAIEAEIARGE